MGELPALQAGGPELGFPTATESRARQCAPVTRALAGSGSEDRRPQNSLASWSSQIQELGVH